jgi:hypothetical protein
VVSAAAILGISTALATSAVSPQTAAAVTYRPVYYHYYAGPTAGSDCYAAGDAGRQSGSWDFYRCTAGSGVYTGQTLLTGYIFYG